MTGVLAALQSRRSHSKLTDSAPSRDEISEMLGAMNHLADHSGLRPWRIIGLRGDARERFAHGLSEATGKPLASTRKKAERAPLLLLLVVSPSTKTKVPLWEQEAVASGAAHMLELLLHDAGWGAMWKSGTGTRSEELATALELDEREYLLGWLHVGGLPDSVKPDSKRKPIDLARHYCEPDS